MEDKILNEIREEYNKKLLIIKKYDIITKRISELEENEAVKEYLELFKSLKQYGEVEHSDKKLIDSAFYGKIYKIKETNDIYVYIGTYIVSNECDIVHGSSDYRVNRNDPKAEYRMYKNIENSEYERITINKCDEFEKTHKIIFPNTILSEEFFYAIQSKFFEIAIKEGQEEACSKILTESIQNEWRNY